MFHWLHHLFNPHCQNCLDEALEDKVCQSCETLKMQLSIVNHEKQQILNSLLSLTSKPETEVTSPAVDFEKLKPTMMTWNVRKRMLEAEDRKSAQLLAEQRKHKESIEKLEEELDVKEEVKTSA